MTAASASSSSPSREQRKKKVKKEGKKAKKAKKDTKKEQPSPARTSVPTFAELFRSNPEMLRQNAEPPPSATLTRGDKEPQRKIAMRSRSRDAPVNLKKKLEEAARDFDAGDKGKGKGKDDGKGKGKGGGEPDGQPPKEEVSFEASGLLGLEDNAKDGVALKFTVPPEARYPAAKWRLYIFTKQTEAPKVIHIHRKLGILFGKDRKVADVPTDHLTCSKQHAVLHYRLVNGMVKPYIMDLESKNGTFLNGDRIESARYYELKERDMLKFGMASREFVLMHAGSANHMAIDPAALRSPE